MPSIPPEYTPYPYVNEVVQLLLENVRTVLGDYFYGLYLYGSLAGGDFDPGHSDIDFLVVTTKVLPKNLIPAIETMHLRVRDSGLEWAKKLEGTYLSKRMLYRYRPSKRRIPYLNEGRFFLTYQGEEWTINRHILREKGVVVDGPPIRPRIARVTKAEIWRAIINILNKYWTPRLIDSDWLKPPGHQPYIAVTCCRVLYTLRYGEIKSKLFSAQWALKALDKEWTDLIKSAMSWHYGMPQGDIKKTKRMVRYTLKEAEVHRARLSGNL
jgi:predicted nucleotidyltransferase